MTPSALEKLRKRLEETSDPSERIVLSTEILELERNLDKRIEDIERNASRTQTVAMLLDFLSNHMAELTALMVIGICGVLLAFWMALPKPAEVEVIKPQNYCVRVGRQVTVQEPDGSPVVYNKVNTCIWEQTNPSVDPWGKPVTPNTPSIVVVPMPMPMPMPIPTSSGSK